MTTIDDQATAGRCTGCHPDALPAERVHEGHVGLRFGDTPNHRWNWQVTLNGQDVTREATEACAGPDGFVVIYDRDAAGAFYACPDAVPLDAHARRHIERGNVTIERAPAGVVE